MTDGGAARWVRLGLAAVVPLVLAVALLPAVRGAPLGRPAAPLNDFDGAWHLACGRLIVEAGEVPREDPLCFTTDGLDWINLNWLAQVALYRAFLAGGFDGPVALAALWLAGTVAFTLLAARARGAGAALALLTLWPLWMTAVRVHSIRPQAVTFTLLALTVWLLARPDPALRLSWPRAGALLATLLAWSHLHGGFVFGLALVGLDAAGACVDARREGLGLLPRRARLLLGVAAAAALGFALHPHGFAALVYAATYTRALGAQLESITELMPLSPASDLGVWLLGYTALGALGLWLSPERLRARELLAAAFFFALSWKMRRAIVPFALVSAPVFAAAWTRALEGRVGGRVAALDRLLTPTAAALPAATAALAAAYGALLLALAGPARPGQASAPPFPPDAPVAAVQWLQARGGDQRVFGRYSDGGLLVWALYPARRVFIDGRGDLHARGRAYDDYEHIAHQRPGWTERLDAWGVDLVVLGNLAPPLLALEREHGWRRVHDDGHFAVVERPPP
ncbi:MAG: hypothetical protein M9894_30695 [Planctomycetes bacterium]|nr:hypothetical protein [Planctomycetota bacterium]